MKIGQVSEDYSVAPQIRATDVAEIAALGFKSVMCNRPDGEAPDQTASDAIRAEVEKAGLVWSFVPVVSGQITAENVMDFKTAIEGLPTPVLAYCRSGARCQNLWMLAQK